MVSRVVVGGANGNGSDVVVFGRGAFVVAALPQALAHLEAFQLALRVPSTITVHDDVHAFVTATGRTTPTLRAWSTFDAIHLLPRDTWNDPSSSSTERRLAHELCHLALWQRSGVDRARAIPRFVTEGACSVVADQGSQRLPIEATRAREHEAGALDFDDDSAFSYAYAHHVFAAVARCRGPAGVVAVVDATAAGATVEQALGAPPRQLLHDDGCG